MLWSWITTGKSKQQEKADRESEMIKKFCSKDWWMCCKVSKMAWRSVEKMKQPSTGRCLLHQAGLQPQLPVYHVELWSHPFQSNEAIGMVLQMKGIQNVCDPIPLFTLLKKKGGAWGNETKPQSLQFFKITFPCMRTTYYSKSFLYILLF